MVKRTGAAFGPGDSARMHKARGTTKAHETQQRIRRAALDLFQERGFEETTMREIAQRASMATGATYYYFPSKEAIVLDFYLRTQEEMEETIGQGLERRSDLRERLHHILDLKLKQFEPHRKFLGALFRTAVDPESSLSPFGDHTGPIRERAIALFRKAIEESNVKVPDDLKSELPRLLWLYQMGIILFWIYDRSPGQRRTRRLMDKSLDLVVGAIKLARLSILAPLRKAALETLASLD